MFEIITEKIQLLEAEISEKEEEKLGVMLKEEKIQNLQKREKLKNVRHLAGLFFLVS